MTIDDGTYLCAECGGDTLVHLGYPEGGYRAHGEFYCSIQCFDLAYPENAATDRGWILE
jgi:hypothetical protein